MAQGPQFVPNQPDLDTEAVADHVWVEGRRECIALLNPNKELTPRAANQGDRPYTAFLHTITAEQREMHWAGARGRLIPTTSVNAATMPIVLPMLENRYERARQEFGIGNEDCG